MYEELQDEFDDFEYDNDRADMLYDMMRDDFLCIQSEDDAKRCLRMYPTQADRFMPVEYRYLMEVEK